MTLIELRRGILTTLTGMDLPLSVSIEVRTYRDEGENPQHQGVSVVFRDNCFDQRLLNERSFDLRILTFNIGARDYIRDQLVGCLAELATMKAKSIGRMESQTEIFRLAREVCGLARDEQGNDYHLHQKIGELSKAFDKREESL